MRLVHDATRFFAVVRTLFKNGLSQAQVDSLNALLTAADPVLDSAEQLAYLLATTYHETGGTMLPIEEYGRGRGRSYGRQVDLGPGGVLKPYTTPKQLFYGRGYCQLTWLGNYRTMSRLLGIDLVNHPERALEVDVAAGIIVQGMTKGLFTGRRLKDYFYTRNGQLVADPLNARRIINGMDCAKLIAGHYIVFLTALRA